MSSKAIELRLTKVQQLFNSLDPTPFPERDLDEAAVRFIVEWAEELPSESALTLRLHLPESERDSATAARLDDAIASYFEYRHQAERRHLHGLLRLGRRSLAIGLAFLAFCNLSSEALASLSEGTLSSLMQDGLIIFGWVANWRPAEIFLYDWWPIHQRARLYHRLSEAPVVLHFAEGDRPPEVRKT